MVYRNFLMPLCLFAFSAAYSSEEKKSPCNIAIIDSRAVMSKNKTFLSFQKETELKILKVQKELEAYRQKMMPEVNKIQAAMGSDMSPEKKKETEKKAIELQKQYEEKAQKAEVAMRAETEKGLKKLNEDYKETVAKTIAKLKEEGVNIDVVIEKDATQFTSPNAMDLTEKVSEALDGPAPAPAA